jgi:hypothetical protein
MGRMVTGQLRQNRIKPSEVKAFVMRELIQEEANQTHGEYPPIFQWLGMAWRPDFGKI